MTYRKGETELVIIVTMYLVKPVNAKDIKLPTDGYPQPMSSSADRLPAERWRDRREQAPADGG